MSECRNHDAFCNAAGSGFGPFCSAPADGTSVPPMRMYFHAGTYDIILFHGWVPTTGWQYALSCLAIIAMGVVVQGMRVRYPVCSDYRRIPVLGRPRSVGVAASGNSSVWYISNPFLSLGCNSSQVQVLRRK